MTHQRNLTDRPGRRGKRQSWLHGGLLLLCLGLMVMPSLAQPGTATGNEREEAQASAAQQPGVAAVLDSPAAFGAQRVTSWREGGSQYLLLEGDARFEMGAYAYRGQRMVARITNRAGGEAVQGRPVREVRVYVEEAAPGREGAAVSVAGPEALVSGATVGRITLETDRLVRADGVPDHPTVQASARAWARRDAARAARQPAPDVATDEAPPSEPAQVPEELAQALEPEEDAKPTEPVVVDEPAEELSTTEVVEAPAPASDAEAVLPTAGTVRFTADRVVFDRRPDESVLMLIGEVRLLYEDAGRFRNVVLQAERAVVFLDLEAEQAEPLAGTDLPAGQVTGIYLEDNIVITDGQFTMRAPRIFYDLVHDQAVVLDAVLYTWNVQRQIPLYMRADLVRQTSRTSFEAEGALLTTSEFAVPHFAVGANRVTLDMFRDDRGVMRQRFTARHTTLQVQEVPVFYWPYVTMETGDSSPLRGVGVGRSRARGIELETEWDVLALAGIEAPDGVEMIGRADYRGRSGPAIGGELTYDLEGAHGRLEGYFVPIDSAEDRVGDDRIRIDRDDDTRGFIRSQHRQVLPDNWYADVELAYVSDEMFLESFFPSEAYDAKPYQTSLYLRKQEPEWAADLWVSGQLTNFTEQLTVLQAPGFQVERIPELGYFTTGVSLLDNRLTWYSENRFSRVRARFGRDTPADRGFTDDMAQELFGIDSDVRFVDAAEADGFPTDWRLRADTRQELTMPLAFGPLSVTPYAVGRITAYDSDFEDYRSEDEQVRLWGSLGIRASTQFHRSYDGFQSQLFNVNRLRHIIEPSIDLFLIGTNVDAGDLPEYDRDIEGIADGSGVRLGLRQTLQTQRGGPGRWRSVDWITLQTDLVFRSRDGNRQREPIARYFEYRPEFALGGDHFYSQLLWMVSDTLGVTGELVYDFQDSRVSQWRVGASLEHTPRLTSFIHYRDIQAIDSRLLSYGFTYQLTAKYLFSFAHRLDLRENESRSVDLWLERRLPRARLRILASFDQVDDEQIFGVVLAPEGFMTENPFSLGGRGW